MKRFCIVSLGCPKNLVDSEYICERFLEEGYTLVADKTQADLVVVNTCAFLTSAVRESIETVLEAKAEGRDVVCAGCLVSRYGAELARELPEVSLFAGPGSYEGIVKAYESNASFLKPDFSAVVARSFTSRPFSAYVKVSEGCSNGCAYCLIPFLRGSLLSKPIDAVVDECRALADKGIREVVLVGQDVGSYGVDLGMKDGIADLIEHISALEPLQWIRVMYVHPASLGKHLVEQLAHNPKVCPYIDLPIQHVSGRVLDAMGRRGGAEAVMKALEMLSCAPREIWIRTSLMVGHPGEDENAFEELVRFVSEGRFHHAGVFVYSPEEGTQSATRKNRPSARVAAARRRRIMAIQQSISKKRLKTLVGSTIEVLVEGRHPQTDLLLWGRASFQAPEVDGTVLINEGNARAGSIVAVEVTRAWAYDLAGRITQTIIEGAAECAWRTSGSSPSARRRSSSRWKA